MVVMCVAGAWEPACIVVLLSMLQLIQTTSSEVMWEPDEEVFGS